MIIIYGSCWYSPRADIPSKQKSQLFPPGAEQRGFCCCCLLFFFFNSVLISTGCCSSELLDIYISLKHQKIINNQCDFNPFKENPLTYKNALAHNSFMKVTVSRARDERDKHHSDVFLFQRELVFETENIANILLWPTYCKLGSLGFF